MGTGASSYRYVETNKLINLQKSIQDEISIPLTVQVAHFTPSSFPLVPIINSKTTNFCSTSWSKIVANDAVDEYGASVSGMTAFYSEFYDRLDALDSTGKFEAVLSRHSSAENKVEAKGAILIRIINFVLNIEADTRDVQLNLFMLGKSHSQKSIRPWQYSVFIQTLLNTIASRLGTEATGQVMEAWVNLFAFVMKSMLPPAISGQVVETELSINTSSEFAGGKLAEEVAEIEEVREVRKKMKKSSSQASSARESMYSERVGILNSERFGARMNSARQAKVDSIRLAPSVHEDDEEKGDDDAH